MAKWPMQLQQHERTCVRFMADDSSTILTHAPGADHSLFAGFAPLSAGNDSNASTTLNNIHPGTPSPQKHNHQPRSVYGLRPAVGQE